MNKTKSQKGITLVALIITIIVLLILAVVAIRAVTGDGIIIKAKDAKNEHTIAQEKEEILLAQSEWILNKYSKTGQTFKAFMEGKLVDVAKSITGDDNEITIITKNGYEYKVTNGGTVVPIEKGITITPPTLTLRVGGETGTVTATLTGGLTGTITYSSDDETVATVSAAGAVTPVAEGTATITATCGTYTATCEVIVNEIMWHYVDTTGSKIINSEYQR